MLYLIGNSLPFASNCKSFFLITLTIFSHRRSAQFLKQNTKFLKFSNWMSRFILWFIFCVGIFVLRSYVTFFLITDKLNSWQFFDLFLPKMEKNEKLLGEIECIKSARIFNSFKAISILAGNFNSGSSYLITALPCSGNSFFYVIFRLRVAASSLLKKPATYCCLAICICLCLEQYLLIFWIVWIFVVVMLWTTFIIFLLIWIEILDFLEVCALGDQKTGPSFFFLFKAWILLTQSKLC